MFDDTDWKEFVGKRCLISTRRWEEIPSEVTILEVSPKGDYIKVKYKATGDIRWFSKYRITFQEELNN